MNSSAAPAGRTDALDAVSQRARQARDELEVADVEPMQLRRTGRAGTEVVDAQRHTRLGELLQQHADRVRTLGEQDVRADPAQLVTMPSSVLVMTASVVESTMDLKRSPRSGRDVR